MIRTKLGLMVVGGAILFAICWSMTAAPAEAKGKNKGNKEHKARGKVVSVATAADGTGSITIKLQQHKKKGAAVAAAKPQAATKTFQFGPNTVFQAVSDTGKKPVTVAAIRKGERVVIAAKGGPADEVDIVAHKGKHKKAIAVALN